MEPFGKSLVEPENEGRFIESVEDVTDLALYRPQWGDYLINEQELIFGTNNLQIVGGLIIR